MKKFFLLSNDSMVKCPRNICAKFDQRKRFLGNFWKK